MCVVGRGGGRGLPYQINVNLGRLIRYIYSLCISQTKVPVHSSMSSSQTCHIPRVIAILTENMAKENKTYTQSNALYMPWYIGVNPWLWIKGFRVRFPSMPGTFVLQQDTLSTLLLSTQVYKWVPGRMWRICCICICLNANIGSSARNAPLGVEIVHCKCGLEIVSNDRGNNTVAPWTSSLDGYVRIINAAIIIIIVGVKSFWRIELMVYGARLCTCSVHGNICECVVQGFNNGVQRQIWSMGGCQMLVDIVML